MTAPLTPALTTPGVVVYQGDARDVLLHLPTGSVNCVLTSPPYYGLRNYDNIAQIGLEDSPERYVRELVHVFHLAKRVLADDGVVWLNLGDTYASKSKGSGGLTAKQVTNAGSFYKAHARFEAGVPDKNLLGIPWRVAFALQDDGWILRSDVIWHKPNVMPESATDRPTKSHEHVFLLTKSPRYFFDADAIREPAAWERWGDQTSPKYEGLEMGGSWVGNGERTALQARAQDGKNARDVWTIPTQPVSDAHFATMPEDLAERCIKSGCPVGGTVLDPFFGSGTTGLVARDLDRNAIGVELNPAYIEIAAKRLGRWTKRTMQRRQTTILEDV